MSSYDLSRKGTKRHCAKDAGAVVHAYADDDVDVEFTRRRETVRLEQRFSLLERVAAPAHPSHTADL